MVQQEGVWANAVSSLGREEMKRARGKDHGGLYR